MKGFLTSLAIAIAFSGSLSAQIPDIDATKTNTVIPIDSDIRTGTLPNGLRYYIKHNEEPEKFIEFRLAVKVGALQEDPDQNGLAHFSEHMLFNGTEKYPENKLLDFLEKTGARFGADINAYTNFDETVYMIPISNEGDNLEKGVEILSQWAHKALFDEKEIDAERGVIISEYRQRRNAQGRVQEKLAPITFYNAKHVKHNIIGDTTLLQEAPYEAFTRFYGDWYIPQNQAVVVVGDIDVDETEKLIKKHFAGIKNPSKPRQIVEHSIKNNPGIIAGVATDPEMPYAIASVYMKGPKESDGTIGDYRKGYIDGLIATMFSMRVQEKIQSGNPPFRQAFASYTGDFSGISAFIINVVPKTEDIKGGLESALGEVYRAYQGGFTKSELDRAKTQVLTGYETGYKARKDAESGNLAMEYVRNFLNDEPIPGIAYEYAMAQQFDKNITLAEVNQRYKSYIRKENIAVTVAAPEQDGVEVPSESELISLVANSAKASYEAYSDDTEGMELFTKNLTPGKIKSESADDKTGVITFELSNGVIVKVKPTDFKSEEIMFRASSPGGTSVVSNGDFQNATYSASLVNASGLGKYDTPTLMKLLAGKNANVSPYVGELYEGFFGQSTPKDLETMFQLVHMYFTDPAKNMEAYDSWKIRTIDGLKQRANNPISALQDTIGNVMSGYHFRSMPTTVETIESVDLDKAYQLYKQRFNDANDFTYYMVGDIDLNTLRPYLEKYMATLPTKPSKETWKDIGEKTPKGNLNKKIYKGLDDKAHVFITINDEFDYNRENNIELDLLKTVVDFAMIKRLREEKGGVYSPSVFYSTSKNPKEKYSVSVYFSCDPGRVDELIETVTDYYKEVKKEGTKADDLEKFLSQEKTQFELSVKDNGAWMSWMMSADQNGIAIEEYLDYKNHLDKIKLDDIKMIANKYLRESELKTFVMYPSDFGGN